MNYIDDINIKGDLEKNVAETRCKMNFETLSAATS